jgi:hypothetical protein
MIMHLNDDIWRIFILWSGATIFIQSVVGKLSKNWHIGRVPPRRFEYDSINGFFTPQRARRICENDLQCGGFTFKGSKDISNRKAEVYFFHFVNDELRSLTEYMKYPHWTAYITSKDYIVIQGQYAAKSCKFTKLLNK